MIMNLNFRNLKFEDRSILQNTKLDLKSSVEESITITKNGVEKSYKVDYEKN